MKTPCSGELKTLVEYTGATEVGGDVLEYGTLVQWTTKNSNTNLTQVTLAFTLWEYATNAW